MSRSLAQLALVVRDYDETIEYFTTRLDFRLIEDTVLSPDKRWVVLAPGSGPGCRLLLARAANEEQASRIGNQTGGRVFLFLETDDFWRDYENFRERGVTFVREPSEESFGTVAVFQDLYGNLWDLIGRRSREPVSAPSPPSP